MPPARGFFAPWCFARASARAFSVIGLFFEPASAGSSSVLFLPSVGRLRARGHVIADQYAMVRRSGFDEVEIPGARSPGRDESIGAALDLPLFDGGRRRAEVDAARAEADARFGEYRLTFLEALGEVENALVALDANGQRIDALSEAIEQSEAALEQSDALYREGLATLFDVLDAQRQLIASRQSLIDSQAALATSFISFHAAIGAPDGGLR